MDIEQALSQAELFIRQNQTSQARMLLGEILHEDAKNEEAWILSAQVSDKPEQVLYCLRQAIKINPASSRARFLLERLQPSQTTRTTSALPNLTPEPLPETQPVQPPAEAQPEQAARYNYDFSFPESEDYVEEMAAAAPLAAQEPAVPLRAQPAAHRRPSRWLPRIFVFIASFCLFAPWVYMVSNGTINRTLTGIQILLGPILSRNGADIGIASLALLAAVVLLMLMLFRFESAAAQKWAERSTIALVPLASMLALDLTSFYYARLTSGVALAWGLWASSFFYTLAGLAALLNARLVGKVTRVELSRAWAGWIFTWLFSLGDVLAIVVTMLGMVMTGKFSLIGIGLPFIWLLMGALLSHIA